MSFFSEVHSHSPEYGLNKHYKENSASAPTVASVVTFIYTTFHGVPVTLCQYASYRRVNIDELSRLQACHTNTFQTIR